MSLAIKFGDSTDELSLSGAIYFSAVTKYDKQWNGKVTEHPVEAGANITDHYISQNPKYSISGVISHVDFSTVPSQLSFDGDPVMNNQEAPTPVIINDMGSALERIIPGSFQQFLPKTRPTIIVDPTERMNSKMSIENFLQLIMTGMIYNTKRKKWENRMTTCTLYEMKGKTPTRPIGDLVLVNATVNEDEDTGDALMLDLSFEQVTFVTLDRVEAPKPRKGSDTDKKTSDKKNKGNQNGTINDSKKPPKDRVKVLDEIDKGNNSITGGG